MGANGKLHAYAFELYAPDGTKVQGTPVYLAARAKDARFLARQEAPGDFAVGAGTHVRDRCPAGSHGGYRARMDAAYLRDLARTDCMGG